MLFPSVRDVACFQQVCEEWTSTLRSRLKATPLKQLVSGGGPPARAIWDATVAHAGLHELILRERFANAVISCGTTAKARELLGGSLISPTRELLETIDRCRKLKYVKSEAEATDVNDGALKALHAQWLDAVVKALPRVVIQTSGLPVVCVEENEHCILKLGGEDGAAWRELLASPQTWVDHIRGVVHTPFPDKAWRVSNGTMTVKGSVEEVVLPVLDKLAARVHDMGVVATAMDIDVVAKGEVPDGVVVFQCGPRTHAVRGADALDTMRAVVAAKTKTQNDSMDRFLEEAAVVEGPPAAVMHMHSAVRALVDMDIPFRVESAPKVMKEEKCDCVDGSFSFRKPPPMPSGAAAITEVAVVASPQIGIPHHTMTTNDWERLMLSTPPSEFLVALLSTNHTLHCSVEDVPLTQPSPGPLFGGPAMLVCPPCSVLRMFAGMPMASPVIAARGPLVWVADTAGHDPASSVVVVRNRDPVWRVFRVHATGTIEFPLKRWITATCGLVPSGAPTDARVFRVSMKVPRFDVVGGIPGVHAMAALNPENTSVPSGEWAVKVLTEADIARDGAAWCISARHVDMVRVRDCWPGEIVSMSRDAVVPPEPMPDADTPYMFRIGNTELPIVTRKALGVWTARYVPYKTAMSDHPIDDRVCTLLNRQVTTAHPWKALWAQRGRVTADAWAELRRINNLDVEGLTSAAKLRGLNLTETRQTVRPTFSRAGPWVAKSAPMMLLHTLNWRECCDADAADSDTDGVWVVLVKTAPDTFVAFTSVGIVTTDIPSSQCVFTRRVALQPDVLPMTAALQINLSASTSTAPIVTTTTASPFVGGDGDDIKNHVIGWVQEDDGGGDDDSSGSDDDIYDQWRASRFPNARPVHNKERDLWDPFFVLQKSMLM